MYVDELSNCLHVSICVHQGQIIPPAEYAKELSNSKWCHERFTAVFKVAEFCVWPP